MSRVGSRRSALRQLFGGLAAAVVAACRPRFSVDSGMGPAAESQGDTASACADLPHGDADEGWVAVSLAQHPELEAVGGQAAVDLSLIHI